MKFLVVDDDFFSRSMFSSALCHLELGTVDEAENGRDAVLKFVNAFELGNPYNMILLDYEMPIMNGREAFNMIRMFEQDHPKKCANPVPIMLISSRNDIVEIFGDVLPTDSRLCVLDKQVNFNTLNALCKLFTDAL